MFVRRQPETIASQRSLLLIFSQIRPLEPERSFRKCPVCAIVLFLKFFEKLLETENQIR